MDLSKYLGRTGGATPSKSPKFNIGSLITAGIDFASHKTGVSTTTTTRIVLALFAFAILVAAVYIASMFIHVPGLQAPLPTTGAPVWTDPGVLDTVAANVNLIGDASGSITKSQSQQYTMSFEMQIRAPFENTGALRHIVHRGGSVYAKPRGSTVPVAVAETNLQQPLGLTTPIQGASGAVVMNPGVFLQDSTTNTLFILVQDSTGAEVATVVVPDIPVFRTVRITIVVSSFLMDVYIDCKLAKTAYLTGTVPSTTLTSVWGHLGTDFPGIMGGLRFWPEAFTPGQVQQICKIKPVLTATGSDYTASSCPAPTPAPTT